MRSEFEKNRYWIGLFKTDVEFNGLLGEFGRYELNGSREVNHSYLDDFNSKWEAYAKAWQHQQTKVDELQKKNAWLSDVAERENKRANKLQEEIVSTTALLGKTIQEKNELQKRVDAVKGLAQTLWEKSEEKHQQGKVWESKTLGECADEILDVLEQALKGGGE